MCKTKIIEVMHPLCILESDILQKDTLPVAPVPSQGSESGLSDDSLPPIYLPNVLPIINIYHNSMAGIAGVNSLLPSLSQCFPLWSCGLFLWFEESLLLLWTDRSCDTGFWSMHSGGLQRGTGEGSTLGSTFGEQICSLKESYFCQIMSNVLFS